MRLVTLNGMRHVSGLHYSPDGRRFLMMPLLSTEADATQIRLILNVLAELRRKIR